MRAASPFGPVQAPTVPDRHLARLRPGSERTGTAAVQRPRYAKRPPVLVEEGAALHLPGDREADPVRVAGVVLLRAADVTVALEPCKATLHGDAATAAGDSPLTSLHDAAWHVPNRPTSSCPEWLFRRNATDCRRNRSTKTPALSGRSGHGGQHQA